MSIYEYDFQGKKPSIKQLLKQIDEGIRLQSRAIELTWGENTITLYRIGYNEQWHGSGWIKDIGGYDIAQNLNRKRHNQILNLWNS